jgi:hypothetical protein
MVLYLGGHGNETGFALFGAGGKAELLSYRDLADRLRTSVHPSVKVTVVIDACRAGAAIPLLDARPNTTVITATSGTASAPNGVGNERSFTEAIVEARSRAPDLDRDGVVDVTESATRVVLQDPQFSRIGARIRHGVAAVVSPTPQPATAAVTVTATPIAAARTLTPVTPPPTVATPRPVTARPQTGAPPTAPHAPVATPQLTPLPTLPGVGRITFTPPALPSAVAGREYEGPYLSDFARDGSPPYNFRLDTLGGFPPQGIVLSPSGVLSGVPAAATAGRSYTFVICAVDLAGNAACSSVSLVVSAPPAIALTSRQCQSLSTAPPILYRLTMVGRASGPVGTRLSFGLGRQQCPGWTDTGFGFCERKVGQPEAMNWTASWDDYFATEFASSGWVQLIGTSESVRARCP